jgi:hypothetical protein
MSTVILACLIARLGAAAGSAEAPANLVANPSFEQQGKASAVPHGWHGDSEVYGTDATVSYSGHASLKFVNDDPQRYRLCTQRVPLPPGSKCRFSAWIKTKDISGNDSGATICLEWQNKDGKWLGGRYPSGVKGTSDWTQVEEVTRVPENAASCAIACYVRQGMTGTAWFDDVEVVRLVDPPMRTVLLSPAYRGRITAAGPGKAQVRVRLNLADHDLKPVDLRLEARLRDATDNKTRWESTFVDDPASGGQLDLSIPVRGLPVGRYDLGFRLLGPEGKELQTAHHTLTRVPDDFRPKCAIDEHHRLLVDGKPFFPLGMYFSNISEADLKVYAESKFNCLMPYGTPTEAQMDLAQQYGLKVIYSIKDWYAGSHYCPKSIRSQADEEPQVRARVRQFRDHPALLAWYLNDELPQQFLPRLEAHQTWVAEEDPQHPTWCVLYQFREVAAYLNTFDVIGTDPYPIGRSPASMAAEWTAETFRQVERARPMWQVPQAHNWANYAKTEPEKRNTHTPSYEEKRSMAWQCICEGATGLVFYSWRDVQRNPDVPFADQWDGLKRIAAEIDRLTPMLLSVEPVPAVKVHGPASVQGSPRWLHWMARRHGGKLYVFAVNDGDGEGAATFSLPQEPRSIKVLGEDRPLRRNGAGFQDDFRRLAVHLYEVELP